MSFLRSLIRNIVLVFITFIFILIFIATITSHWMISTLLEPDYIYELSNEVHLPEHTYNFFVQSALNDFSEVNIDYDGDAFGDRLIEKISNTHRSDTEDLIAAIFPPSYFRYLSDQAFQEFIPYLSGNKDEFSIDIQISARIKKIPAAFEAFSSETELGELINQELLEPALNEFILSLRENSEFINVVDTNTSAMTSEVFPPEWIEGELLQIVEEITSWVLEGNGSLLINISINDRGAAIVEAMQRNIGPDYMTSLVFKRVIDPVLDQMIEEVTQIGFGLVMDDDQVLNAIEIMAPEHWVAKQGNLILEALIYWVMDDTDSLSVKIDLRERKTESIQELKRFFISDLETKINALPVCDNQSKTIVSVSDVLKGEMPACLPPNSERISDQMIKVISVKIEEFVSSNVPDELLFSESNIKTYLGNNNFETTYGMRDFFKNSLTFSYKENEIPYKEYLNLVRGNNKIDQENLNNFLSEQEISLLYSVREKVKLIISLRWIGFILSFGLLVLIMIVFGKRFKTKFIFASLILTIPIAILIIMAFLGYALFEALGISGGINPDLDKVIHLALMTWLNDYVIFLVPILISCLAFLLGCFVIPLGAKKIGLLK